MVPYGRSERSAQVPRASGLADVLVIAALQVELGKARVHVLCPAKEEFPSAWMEANEVHRHMANLCNETSAIGLAITLRDLVGPSVKPL